MYSEAVVKDILETAIDSLVDNFSRQPYIHRCEHSIHCELYSMLAVHRMLQGIYPLKDGMGRSTTLIHKEWPETIPRPEKKRRRGNFDLAILDPVDVQQHTVEGFSDGLIKPAFVVEMGLNYDLMHLTNDDSKLTNSACSNGYLVHLRQPHKGIRDADVTALENWCTGKTYVAAAVFTNKGLLVKHLNDSQMILSNGK